MKIDPLISRALGYPYPYPTYDFIIDKGSLNRLEDRDCLEGRVPVLAIGSNKSPEQLLRKFGHQDFLPVTFVKLCDYDVVYAAHMASYGSIPAILTASPGTIIEIAVTWLSKLQLEHMHKTEAIGVNYDYGIAKALKIISDYDYENQEMGCYLGRRGCLSVKGDIIALTEIIATNRVFKEFKQSEILKEIYSNVSEGEPFEAWLKRLINNKEARQSATSILTQNAIVNVLPAFKISHSKGL
jgi:hypothetical protein